MKSSKYVLVDLDALVSPEQRDNIDWSHSGSVQPCSDMVRLLSLIHSTMYFKIVIATEDMEKDLSSIEHWLETNYVRYAELLHDDQKPLEALKKEFVKKHEDDIWLVLENDVWAANTFKELGLTVLQVQ